MWDTRHAHHPTPPPAPQPTVPHLGVLDWIIANPKPTFVILLVLYLLYVVVSSRYWPHKPCGDCRAGRKYEPFLFKRASRPCSTCGGRGRVLRIPTQFLWRRALQDGRIKMP